MAVWRNGRVIAESRSVSLEQLERYGPVAPPIGETWRTDWLGPEEAHERCAVTYPRDVPFEETSTLIARLRS